MLFNDDAHNLTCTDHTKTRYHDSFNKNSANGIYIFLNSWLITHSHRPYLSSSSTGAWPRTDNITKAPYNIVITAVKLTSKASGPYLSIPELSRKVSFSKHPKAAFPTAKIYTKIPNSTCQGRDSLLIIAEPPG